MVVVVALSLRERSKAKRRVAIQRAAMRLFAERGYDGATIADIAERAELAPRTVTMYFPNKIDIAMSTSSDMAVRFTTIFEANPDLSFTELVDHWLLGETESADHDLAALAPAMFDANPALRAVSTARIAEASSVARPAFLAELGLPPDHPMVKVVGAAIGGAIAEYLTASGAASRSEHDAFIRFLRTIISAAHQPEPGAPVRSRRKPRSSR